MVVRQGVVVIDDFLKRFTALLREKEEFRLNCLKPIFTVKELNFETLCC